MRITLAQTAPKLNRTNLEEIIALVKEYENLSDVIVFPELALNGYILQDKLLEDAWSLDELEVLVQCSVSIDIVVGAAICENKEFKNQALYFSKGKLLSQHTKVHLPNYGMFEEARYFTHGEVFESFFVEYGRISMLVCEDMWHESVHQDLIKENPDYIYVLVASPARGFEEEGLVIEKKWYAILEKVAQECKAEVIFVNRVGFEDGLGFWGGSAIINNDGKIVHKLNKFEQEIVTFEL